MNTNIHLGGDHLHDDNYPKVRSGRLELDSQEDLVWFPKTHTKLIPLRD
jgi:hypothetical protein